MINEIEIGQQNDGIARLFSKAKAPLVILSIDHMFDEQKFGHLRWKHNHSHMSDDVKRELQAEIRHFHHRQVDLRPEGLSRERRLCRK